MQRDNFTCRYCGGKNKVWEIDHVKPLSWGGNDYTTNLVLSCKDCNQLKGAHYWKPFPISAFYKLSAFYATIQVKDYPQLRDFL